MNETAVEVRGRGYLLDLLDRSIFEAYREVARRSAGRIEEADGLVFVVGAHPSPVIVNTVFRTEPRLAPRDALRRMRAYYEQIGHGFGLMTSEHTDSDLDEAAASEGWEVEIKLPGMVLLGPLGSVPVPTDASLLRLDPERDLDAFRRVTQAGFAESADERDMVASTFSSPRSLTGPNCAAFIARYRGVDAAAAMVLVVHGIAVVGWVSTVPEFRRHGLGELVTRASTNAGFELGAQLAVLQASPMGYPLYVRLGYEAITRYRIWLPPAEAR